jgi:hypothetical protein
VAVLLDAVAAVLVVTASLALTSLDRRTALLLGATGSLVGNFLAWLAAPRVWEGSLVLPWVAAVVGTVLLVAGWSVARAYTDLYDSNA